MVFWCSATWSIVSQLYSNYTHTKQPHFWNESRTQWMSVAQIDNQKPSHTIKYHIFHFFFVYSKDNINGCSISSPTKNNCPLKYMKKNCSKKYDSMNRIDQMKYRKYLIFNLIFCVKVTIFHCARKKIELKCPRRYRIY